MKFGLSDNLIKNINQIFERYPKVSEVVIFGSRAKGDYRDGSDIDLALKGNDLRLDDVLNLSVKLEDIIFPYKVDLLNFGKVKDPDVIEHINRAGKIFYQRT